MLRLTTILDEVQSRAVALQHIASEACATRLTSNDVLTMINTNYSQARGHSLEEREISVQRRELKPIVAFSGPF
jgi:hypothetical protein